MTNMNLNSLGQILIPLLPVLKSFLKTTKIEFDDEGNNISIDLDSVYLSLFFRNKEDYEEVKKILVS